jgi:hypothetical protein
MRYFALAAESLSRALKRGFVVASIVRDKSRTYLRSNDNSNSHSNRNGEEADPLRG